MQDAESREGRSESGYLAVCFVRTFACFSLFAATLAGAALVQRYSGSALWPSAGYGFCDGGDTNNAEVDAHARGGLGIAQDFGMAGPAAGPPAHMYGAVAPQDSE